MTILDVVREGCVSWLPIHINAEASTEKSVKLVENLTFPNSTRFTLKTLLFSNSVIFPLCLCSMSKILLTISFY